MVKEVEELIKIVGKGNLLETLFIFLGSFQHADLDRSMDHRNHFGLSAFIKKEGEPLDEYFNLKFSLQGLFLIYVQAYRVLAENAQLNTQEVIDKIYATVESGRTSTTYNALGELLRRIVDQAGLTEDQKKLKLLNILANPKGKALFNNNNDFEKQVLNDVKKLLKINYANEFDKEFSLCKEVINHYYSIHNIKADKDIALFFSLGGHYKELSSSNKTVKREVLEICENQLIESYIMFLAGKLHMIGLSSRDKYTIDHENVDRQEKALKMDGLIYPINTKNTLGSVDKILEKPYKSSNKIEKTHKNLSSFIKSGKNAPKIFNFTKKTLNQMTFFVDMLIVIPLHFSIPFWRNNYCTSLVFKTCNKGIAIVALVSYYSRVIDTFGQHLCLRNFISLTRSQSKFKWISKCIDKRMYFSCKATFAPP